MQRTTTEPGAQEPPLSCKRCQDYSRDRTREAGDLGHAPRICRWDSRSAVFSPGGGVGCVFLSATPGRGPTIAGGAARRPGSPQVRAQPSSTYICRPGSPAPRFSPPGCSLQLREVCSRVTGCHRSPLVQWNCPQIGHSGRGATPQQRCGREDRECTVCSS